jgi:peptidylprolyl isomerase
MQRIFQTFFVLIFSLLYFSVDAQLSETYTGLSTLPSGLKYKITKQGKGDFAKPGDKVWLHYVGKLENDSIFTSTLNNGPIDVFLGVGQLIKGWEEGLQLVRPGGAILLIVPPDLAYGAVAQEHIPANATLTFEISLLQIEKGEKTELFQVGDNKTQKAKKHLKYIEIEQGEGPFAKFGDNAYVNYVGFLSDSTIFDSSVKYGGPVRITVGINQVIEGWDMGLQYMQKGSKIRLIIPPKLAYGKTGFKNMVPPNATIYLDLELVDLIPPEPVAKWDTTGKSVIETASGLKYVIFDEGQGDLIESENLVVVNYSGYFLNGELFDSSVKRFEPIRFPVGVGAVIDGWDEGLQLMRKGSKFQLMVPSYLGYGEKGAPPQIPANSDLIFDIEVIDVVK